jgi:hypothetical protein
VARLSCVFERQGALLSSFSRLHEFPWCFFRKRHLHPPTGMQNGRLFVCFDCCLLFFIFNLTATLHLCNSSPTLYYHYGRMINVFFSPLCCCYCYSYAVLVLSMTSCILRATALSVVIIHTYIHTIHRYLPMLLQRVDVRNHNRWKEEKTAKQHHSLISLFLRLGYCLLHQMPIISKE